MSYVVMCSDTGEYLDFDDRPGPMSTGYPYTTDSDAHARRFVFLETAKKELNDPYVQKSIIRDNDWFVAEVRYERVTLHAMKDEPK